VNRKSEIDIDDFSLSYFGLGGFNDGVEIMDETSGESPIDGIVGVDRLRADSKGERSTGEKSTDPRDGEEIFSISEMEEAEGVDAGVDGGFDVFTSENTKPGDTVVMGTETDLVGALGANAVLGASAPAMASSKPGVVSTGLNVPTVTPNSV
jgi:hypothetical protein